MCLGPDDNEPEDDLRVYAKAVDVSNGFPPLCAKSRGGSPAAGFDAVVSLTVNVWTPFSLQSASMMALAPRCRSRAGGATLRDADAVNCRSLATMTQLVPRRMETSMFHRPDMLLTQLMLP